MALGTRGIVLRQTKLPGGRRILLILTKEYGKISCGAFPAKKGKNASDLATHPFAYGEFDIIETRSSYSLRKAEVINSFYQLGESPEKFAAGSYALELTDKVLHEDIPAEDIFELLVSFLTELDQRRTRFGTLVLAYEVKLLGLLGISPETSHCARCGSEEELKYFSVSDGGMLCASCREERKAIGRDALIYDADFGMIGIIEYFESHPLSGLKKLALNEKVTSRMHSILREYFGYHFELGSLKSEGMLSMVFEI